jgi:hypothetical protein
VSKYGHTIWGGTIAGGGGAVVEDDGVNSDWSVRGFFNCRSIVSDICIFCKMQVELKAINTIRIILNQKHFFFF